MEKEENKLANLESSRHAEINGVPTKRGQLIRMKARQRGGGISPREFGVVFVRLGPKEKCDDGTTDAFGGLGFHTDVSTTSDSLFALRPSLLFFSCLALLCPPSRLREERVLIGRLEM